MPRGSMRFIGWGLGRRWPRGMSFGRSESRAWLREPDAPNLQVVGRTAGALAEPVAPRNVHLCHPLSLSRLRVLQHSLGCIAFAAQEHVDHASVPQPLNASQVVELPVELHRLRALRAFRCLVPLNPVRAAAELVPVASLVVAEGPIESALALEVSGAIRNRISGIASRSSIVQPLSRLEGTVLTPNPLPLVMEGTFFDFEKTLLLRVSRRRRV